jgi:hypothetical protein
LNSVQSFCNAQNPSAVGSYRRPNSSTAITFSGLRITQLYIVLQSNQSHTCDVLLVRVAKVCGMTSLNVCNRPVEGNERVKPDALNNYRKIHQFLGPCCLCSLLTPLSEKSKFTEAAMYIPISGRYAGEYVAECAKSRCGYLGELSSWLKTYRHDLHTVADQYH